MKIVHLSTSDRGGAGIAAMRLHRELLKHKVDSNILTRYQFGANEKNHFVFTEPKRSPMFNKTKNVLRRIIGYKSSESLAAEHLKNRPDGYEYFSFPFSELKIENHPIVQQADIIHLHWVSEGFLNYPSFFKKLNKKIVWTLHDMNPFTGGCHHADDCLGFTDKCTGCPQLKGTIDVDYAFEMQALKSKLLSKYTNDRVKIVSPSQWMYNKSSCSALFRRFEQFKIHNGIDGSAFFNIPKEEARKKLNLPFDKKILLLVSHDVSNQRKGIQYMQKALKFISNENVVLCTIGKNPVSLNSSFEQFNLGFITDDEKMCLAYNAADVFILPSLAENFPNTSCEALFCGTPVVAFNVGGLPEQVNEENGILIDQKDSRILGGAINKIFNFPEKFKKDVISAEAENKFGINRMAKKYIELYNSFN